MVQQGKYLNSVILILTLVTMGALLVSTAGAVTQSLIPAYFWYMALASMSALLLLWVVMALMLVVKEAVRRYRRRHEAGMEMRGSWT
jgi:hypothetical protein